MLSYEWKKCVILRYACVCACVCTFGQFLRRTLTNLHIHFTPDSVLNLPNTIVVIFVVVIVVIDVVSISTYTCFILNELVYIYCCASRKDMCAILVEIASIWGTQKESERANNKQSGYMFMMNALFSGFHVRTRYVCNQTKPNQTKPNKIQPNVHTKIETNVAAIQSTFR